MNTPTSANLSSPEAINAFLAETVAKATAAAEACVAFHRAKAPRLTSESSLSTEDWIELDAALDRWLAKRARSNRSPRKAA